MKDQNYINLLISRFRLREELAWSKQNFEEIKTKLAKVEISISKYLSDNPNLKKWKDENMGEARVQWLGESIHEHFKNLKPFDGDPNKIPEIPVMPLWFLKEKVWPGLIKAGAIQKKDLKTGKEYLGSCRNSERATWDGEKFIYTRWKFGSSFEEDIKHFEDDDETGTDVFTPIKEL